MKKERFEELAAAYGGELARWPAETRDDAALLVAAEPAFARDVLAREAALDATLHAWPTHQASGAFYDQIVGSAPALRRSRLRWGWLTPAGLGAALAAAAAAGVMLGVQLSSHVSAASTTASAAATDTTTARAIAEVDLSGLSGDV